MTEQYSFEWCAENTQPTTNDDFSVALEAANVGKNRYKNVLANDVSLVKLNDGKYINANRVCGGRYISCQAPITSTIEDFWKMNFEQKSCVIVMLTNYTEKGKAKATAYFVDGSAKRYGNFIVKVVNTMYPEGESYDLGMQIREIEVTNRAAKEKRTFIHIHYFGWPDFGVPSDLSIVTDIVFLSLVFRGKIKNSEANGPTVVHCSAGIGRSGTFLCMLRLFEHNLMKFVENKNETTFSASTTEKANEMEEMINKTEGKLTEEQIREICAKLVVSMRTERKGMIQTADQLSFLVTVMNEFYNSMLDKFKPGKTVLDVVKPFFSELLTNYFDEFANGLLE